MSAERPHGRLFWTALGGSLAADQITKWLAVERLSPSHVRHEVIGDVVCFTLAYNPGAAFGMHVGPLSRAFFSILAVVMLVVLWRMYRETPPADRARAAGLALIMGGAIGNLLDRLRSPRGVVDFIDLGVGDARFWTFNLADVAITAGTVVLARALLREPQPETAAEPAAP